MLCPWLCGDEIWEAEFMRVKFDFWSEYYELPKTPKTKAEAWKRLRVLQLLDEQSKYRKIWGRIPYSKRRNRLVKMFYAFNKMEKEKAERKILGGSKMKKKQLNAMQRIITRATKEEFRKIRPVTLCENRSGWIALDGYCAVVTPEKPEIIGIVGDESEKVQNMAAQKIVDNFLDDSQFGAENISLPSVKQLAAYIKISGGGRKAYKARPYPLNGGELWVNPIYLHDVMEAMNGSIRAYHNGKLSSPVMLWSDDHNMGVVMPMRFSKDENEKKELLELAEKAKEAAEAPRREKPDNQAQPTNFRAFKRAILSGVVIEMTKPNGKTITGNSLFNGRPTMDISAARSKYWEFEDGYCTRYWDAEEFSRLANNWDYKIRVLGPMNPLAEEQRAAEAEEYKRRLDARNAALADQREKDAAEERARREEEERYHAEQLAKDAEKINRAIQAFKTGGHVDSCMVTITENGHDLEENIFVHLARLYGVSLPARSKGFIVAKLRCVEPNPRGESMRYSAQVKRKLPDGVKSFLFALMETIGEECGEDTASPKTNTIGCTRNDCENCNIAQCENRIADSVAAAAASDTEASQHTAERVPAEHSSAVYAAKIRAKRRELNYYARRAYVTPDSAAHIAQRIESLRAELKQLKHLKTGAGEEVNKAIRQTGNLLWLCEINTS